MPAHRHDSSLSNIGGHSHGILTGNNTDAPYTMVSTQAKISNTTRYTKNAGEHTHTLTLGAEGGSAAHNNLPPFIVCYMFRRLA